MGVQMMNGFGGVQTYYKASQIPSVASKETEQQIQKPSLQEQQRTEGSDSLQTALLPRQEAERRLPIADLENISLTFNKEESFNYLGSESGLAGLDMQKAISDMRKDQVLEQYQQFVGSAQNILKETEDGLVIPKFPD